MSPLVSLISPSPLASLSLPRSPSVSPGLLWSPLVSFGHTFKHKIYHHIGKNVVVCGGVWSALEATEECYSITQFGNRFYAKMATKRVYAAFLVLQGVLFVFET